MSLQLMVNDVLATLEKTIADAPVTSTPLTGPVRRGGAGTTGDQSAAAQEAISELIARLAAATGIGSSAEAQAIAAALASGGASAMAIAMFILSAFAAIQNPPPPVLKSAYDDLSSATTAIINVGDPVGLTRAASDLERIGRSVLGVWATQVPPNATFLTPPLSLAVQQSLDTVMSRLSATATKSISPDTIWVPPAIDRIRRTAAKLAVPSTARR